MHTLRSDDTHVPQAHGWKKPRFLEKVFRFLGFLKVFLGFLGFLDFSVQRQPDKNLPSRKTILDPINHSPCHFVFYKIITKPTNFD